MKKLLFIFGIYCLFTWSCEEHPATIARKKAEKEYAIQKLKNDRKRDSLDMIIELLQVGATKKEAVETTNKFFKEHP